MDGIDARAMAGLIGVSTTRAVQIAAQEGRIERVGHGRYRASDCAKWQHKRHRLLPFHRFTDKAVVALAENFGDALAGIGWTGKELAAESARFRELLVEENDRPDRFKVARPAVVS